MNLTDFQKATVKHIVAQFTAGNCPRMLCADEVGLGKTIVARGVIDRLNELAGNLTVFYVCSSQYLAQKNVSKLSTLDSTLKVNRLTELITTEGLDLKKKGLRIFPLSPGTSVDMKSRGGRVEERAILYLLLRGTKLLKGRWSQTTQVIFNATKGWDRWVEAMEARSFNQSIADRFVRMVESDTAIEGAFAEAFRKGSADLGLIGVLREKLALASLHVLKPDLIILDEFQRFWNLLKESDSDESQLVRMLFKNRTNRMLLLSATPYKVFAAREESGSSTTHEEEFHSLLSYLMGDSYDKFLKPWKEYSSAIQMPRQFTASEKLERRRRCEKFLRRVMTRTERNMAYGETSLTPVNAISVQLDVRTADINNFLSNDRLVQFFREQDGYHLLYSPLEYCKTSPWPLSFMVKYKLKDAFDAFRRRKEVRAVLEQHQECLLPFEKINRYQPLTIPNPKMRWLVERVSEGAQLLWVPPIAPVYALEGPYKNSAGFSKVLTFGRYAVEPRATAVLASYQAEMLCHRSMERRNRIKPYFGDPVTTSAAAIEDLELIARHEKSGRQKARLAYRSQNHSLYSFHYPSLFLSEITNENLNSCASAEQLRTALYRRVKEKLSHIPVYDNENAKPTTARWLLFALLWLDREHYPDDFGNCLESFDGIATSFSGSAISSDFDQLRNFMRLCKKDPAGLQRELGLGPLPPDLAEKLTELAIGQPATLLLSVFKRNNLELGMAMPLVSLWRAVFRTSEGFQSFYNNPEVMTVIDAGDKNAARHYMDSIYRYNAEGCLYSVLEEYYYTYSDGNWNLQVLDRFCEEFVQVLGLVTASLKVDLQDGKDVVSAFMRTHYAVAFADQKETDKAIVRKAEVQNSFNSPFRPFILATTSIGQEGLDFHRYCRKLVHWSLPLNAIDIEQREGRINRYKHFSLRSSLYARVRENHPSAKWEGWKKVFEDAEQIRAAVSRVTDLIPSWYVPEASTPIESYIFLYPLSREHQKYEELRKILATYRLTLGQPDQEGLLHALQNINCLSAEEFAEFKQHMLFQLAPILFEKEFNAVEINQ